ncbi:pilus assembly protein PilM [Comamonas sp. GB3 AK4-5]|uniref:pilus assembly protein PilM n=1 Tax=Comamonas sp. GB3 AK4-5 TaxID=3231487 RepID=UPI00351F15C3
MLGVDIGASSIKLVELGQHAQGRWVLECCAMEPLEKGCVVDGNIEQFDAVVDALRRVLKQSGSKARLAALALPHTAVITQRVVLPALLKEDEMALLVEAEAGHCIPFSLDEVCLDFCVIGPNAKSAEDVDVLLAASRRDKVEERQALAQAVGLQATLLDIETHAVRLAASRLIAAQPQGGRDAVVALLKIGGLSSHVQLVLHGELLFEREQALGGVQLTQMLASHYGCSLAEAEAKKHAGDLPGDGASAVLQPFLHGLAAEVQRSLQFFFSSSAQQSVQQILVFGGSAGLPGMAQAMAQQLQMPVVVANPFQGMQSGARLHPACLAQDAPAYVTACGLAMRRFGPCC